MRKLFFYVFSIFSCMQSCSQSDDLINGKFDLEEEKMQQEISFPDHIEAYGKAVAKELRVTVLRLNEMNVDYSKATGTKEFREKFYKDWFDANPTIAKTRATGVPLTSIMDPIEFAERYKALTEIQLDFVQRIIKECGKSTSYLDLKNRLVDMKEKVCAIVPEIEQERLLNVISVLYYAVQEISHLEDQGLMLRTPYNDIRISKIKTRGNWEGGGGLVSGCTKFLSTVWTIAVGEPTIIGEGVAAVVTAVTVVVVAGVVMYEVVACAADELNKDDCTNRFVDCINSGGEWTKKNSGGWGRTMCELCYRYCETQGVWECPRPVF